MVLSIKNIKKLLQTTYSVGRAERRVMIDALGAGVFVIGKRPGCMYLKEWLRGLARLGLGPGV